MVVSLRLLFLTDTHIRTYAPVSRCDNFQETVFTKLAEVLEIARNLQADLVLHGGDLFDAARVGYGLMGRTAELLRSFPCPVYVVPGNHDLVGYSLQTLPHTSLGVLWRAGVFRLLLEPELLEGADFNLALWPVPAAAEIPPSAYVTGRPQPAFYVVVAHDALLPSPAHPDIPHKVIAPDLSDADLVLAGHWHPGWAETIVSGRTSYVNPGSLLRMDAGPGSRDREVRAVLVTCGPGGAVVEYVPLRSAKPFAEVFRARKDDAGDRVTLDAVAASLSGSGDGVAVDVFTLLRQAEADEEVKKLIYEVAAAAGYSDKQGAWWDAEPVRISELRIAAFQSHADTRLTFAPGLNVITGPSDSGKSAVLRALWWLFYNEPKGAEFINVSSKQASVSAVFSGGTELVRSRTRSSTGTYTVRAPGAEPVTLSGFGHNLPPDVVAVHKAPLLELAGEELSLNIAHQFDPPFVLGHPNAVNLALLDLLTNNSIAFEAVRRLRSEEDDLRRRLAAAVEQKERTSELLAAASQVASLAPRVHELAVACADATEACRRVAEMRDLVARLAVARGGLDAARRAWEEARLDLKMKAVGAELERAEQLLTGFTHEYRPAVDGYNRALDALRRAAGNVPLQKLVAAAHEYAAALERMATCPLCGGSFPGADAAAEVRLETSGLNSRVAALLKEVELMKPLPTIDGDPAVRLRELRRAYEAAKLSVAGATSTIEQYAAEVKRLAEECAQKFGVPAEELDEKIRRLSAELSATVEKLSTDVASLKAECENLVARIREAGSYVC